MCTLKSDVSNKVSSFLLLYEYCTVMVHIQSQLAQILVNDNNFQRSICWAQSIFDLFHWLIIFLFFLCCWTDDLFFSFSFFLYSPFCFSHYFSLHSFILLPCRSSFLVLFFALCHALHVFNLPLSQSSLCSAYDILQCNLRPVWAVVGALLMLESTEPKQKEGKVESDREKETEVKKLIAESTQTPPPSWQIWDLIGSSLLHVFCLVVLFLAYSWSEFK